jgi:hypothetical protein
MGGGHAPDGDDAMSASNLLKDVLSAGLVNKVVGLKEREKRWPIGDQELARQRIVRGEVSQHINRGRHASTSALITLKVITR